MTSRSILFSFVGHLLVLGILFVVGTLTAKVSTEPKVYNVSIVAGVPGPGGAGQEGRPGIPISGAQGKPGLIGGPALTKAVAPKGTALVDEARKKLGAKTPARETARAGNPDQIAMRVYGQGGTIGGGPGSDSGGGFGFGGRPASAYEVAMNNKIVANWNEDLWKSLPNRLACTVQFLIDANGTVSGVQVFESSGNDGFDQAARRAIELALMPAPSAFGIPGNLHEARVTFVNRPE